MKQQRQQGVRRLRRSRGSIKSVLILSASVVLGTTGMYVAVVQPSLTQDPTSSQSTQVPDVSNGETITVNTDGIVSGQGLVADGQLRVNNSLVLNPTSQPTDGTAGQFYFDADTETFRYYDGTSYQSVATEAGVKAAIQANPLLPQQPAVITKVVQAPSNVATEPNNNTFTGKNSFADLSASNLTVSGPTDLQGSLRVAGATLLGPTTSSSLLLSSALSVGSGGTGRSSLPNNQIIIGQGTGMIGAVANGAPGMCLISTSGAPEFQSCPSVSATGVSSFGGLTGNILLGNSSANGNTITLNDATTTTKGLASFNTNNFSVSNGAVNTIQDIAVTSAPMFAGLSVSGAATISGQGTFVTGVDVQGASGITALSLDTATTGPLSIGNVNATTINIGTSNVGRQVNIGTGIAVQGVTIGSQEGESGVVVQSGNGGVAMYSNGGYSYNTRSGERPFEISIGGSAQFNLAADQTFGVGSAYGNLFVVDGNNSRVNLAYNTELNVAGRANFIQGMQITGLSQLPYITPLGTGLNTVINVPNFSVPDYGSILAFGLPSSSSNSARGLLVADARSSSHQPTIGILSPDENNIFGLSFDGLNDVGSLKTIGGSGIRIQPAGVDAALFAAGQIYLNQQTKVSASSSNAFMVQDASSQAVFGVDTLGGSLSIGDAGRMNGSLVVRNATNNYTVTLASSPQTANRTVALGNESGIVCIQNSSNCGFAPGSANSFIQNQNSVQQPSTNYWVSGTGRADTALQAPVLDAATVGALTLGGANATSIAVTQNTSLTTGKTLLITGGATGTRPALPTEGTIYFDTTTKQLIVYANGKWQADRSTTTKIIADGSTSQNPDSADFVVPAGSTSAQTTINAAIASLPANGGSIYLKEGTYQITGTINLPSNVTLVGSGTGSIIKVPSATNTTFTMLNANTINSTNITIQNLKLDGNRSNQTSGTVSGVNLTNTYDSRVTNVVILNTQGTAVDLGVSSVLADSYITANSWVSGMRLVNASKDNAKITNNRLEWGGSVVYVTGSNILVSGNEINFGDQEAVNLSGTNNIISNNTIRSGTNYGIQIGGTGQVVDSNMFLTRPTLYQTVYGVGTESRFTNNFIAAGSSYVSGVNSVVSGNTFKGNADTLNSTNLVLSNNKFAGVTLTVGAQNSSIDSNVFSTSGGLSVGGSNNILKGNVFNTGTSVTDTGLGTVYNNQTDNKGNIINQGTSGYTINTKTSTASLTLQGGMTNSQLPTPGAPAMQIIGSWGSAKYGYRISALDGLGETLASTESTISIGATPLSASNYFIVSWNAVPGATQYKIYRSTSTGSPSTTGLIGTVSGGVVSFNDTGLAASGTLPVANTTGGMNIAGAIQGNSGVQTPTLDTAGATALAVGTTNASAITLGRSGITVSSPASTLFTGASNVFKNTANSATAFQIQDSGSTPLFVADTGNTKIVIRTLDVAYNLTVAGHIISGGAVPTIAAKAAACSAPTVSINGTDTAGVISVTTGTGCVSSGNLSTITFSSPFSAAPNVTLTPASAAAANLNAYLDDTALTVNSFTLGAASTPSDATTYKWHYHALQ